MLLLTDLPSTYLYPSAQRYKMCLPKERTEIPLVHFYSSLLMNKIISNHYPTKVRVIVGDSSETGGINIRQEVPG